METPRWGGLSLRRFIGHEAAEGVSEAVNVLSNGIPSRVARAPRRVVTRPVRLDSETNVRGQSRSRISALGAPGSLSDEQLQQLEHLRGEAHLPARPQQLAALQVQREVTEGEGHVSSGETVENTGCCRGLSDGSGLVSL